MATANWVKTGGTKGPSSGASVSRGAAGARQHAGRKQHPEASVGGGSLGFWARTSNRAAVFRAALQEELEKELGIGTQQKGKTAQTMNSPPPKT
eukprot:CAMPEP_0183354402 /NCGR_PEP_ID=MMETSP0164_2-20130417/37288_1 /TAXON_ID=221442 /ORGANISM="Coccolithus pelagicus ssp braarudi, Strain PLY182g" /LENGTH=93 /DNA_ID=CAMNT_0025527277 /DNA_START=124 /DNA_END=405 /DNA_ORIENTATION=-